MSDSPQNVGQPVQPDAVVHSKEKPQRRARKPYTLTALTLLLFVGFAAAFYWSYELEDAYPKATLDVINIIALVAYFAVSVAWMFWIGLLSNWGWRYKASSVAAIIFTPIAFMIVLRPIFGGDMTIVGFRPIWMAPPVVPDADEVASNDTVNLMPESTSDFPQFLGPQRNAIIQTDLPLDLKKLNAESIQWKIPVGPGWSGFVARNGFAVTMEQRQEKECVTCYRISDGKLMWIYQHDARHEDAMSMGHVGPRSTPIIHQGMVYATGAIGNLVCLDGADGSVVWQVDLNQVLGIQLKQTRSGQYPTQAEESSLEWGRSGSAMIYEDCLIVPGGGPKDGPFCTLLALDLKTGKVKWKAGDEMIAYGSPSLQTVDGVPQILLMAEAKGMSFSASTGEVLWTWDRPGKSSGMANTSQMFAVANDQVLMSKGYPDGGGTLIQVNQTAEGWKTKLVWSSPRVLKTKLTSPVIKDEYAYSICNGFLECCRLTDGKRIWKHRARLAHGQLLLVNDLLVLQSEFGELWVCPAIPDGYQQLAKFQAVDGICWNTLCLTGDKLLVRSDEQAACIQLPVTNSKQL